MLEWDSDWGNLPGSGLGEGFSGGIQHTGGISLVFWKDSLCKGVTERGIGRSSSLRGSRVCLGADRAALAGITGCVQGREMGCRVLGV